MVFHWLLADRFSQPQGGYPERCGICVAAVDTVSQGIQGHFRPGVATQAATVMSALDQTLQFAGGSFYHVLSLGSLGIPLHLFVAIDPWLIDLTSSASFAGSLGYQTAGDPLVEKHVRRLPPGKYCHATWT